MKTKATVLCGIWWCIQTLHSSAFKLHPPSLPPSCPLRCLRHPPYLDIRRGWGILVGMRCSAWVWYVCNRTAWRTPHIGGDWGHLRVPVNGFNPLIPVSTSWSRPLQAKIIPCFPPLPPPFSWGPWIDIRHHAEAFRSSGLYRVF